MCKDMLNSPRMESKLGLVTGESGMGKSTFLVHCMDKIRTEMGSNGSGVVFAQHVALDSEILIPFSGFCPIFLRILAKRGIEMAIIAIKENEETVRIEVAKEVEKTKNDGIGVTVKREDIQNNRYDDKSRRSREHGDSEDKGRKGHRDDREKHKKGRDENHHGRDQIEEGSYERDSARREDGEKGRHNRDRGDERNRERESSRDGTSRRDRKYREERRHSRDQDEGTSKKRESSKRRY